MSATINKKVKSFDLWQRSIFIPADYSAMVIWEDGAWNINPHRHGEESYGPNGSEFIADDRYPFPGAPEGCLIGRYLFDRSIKNNMENFGMNYDTLLKSENLQSFQFKIPNEGLILPTSDTDKILELRCNDIDEGIFDNVGSLLIKITIW